MKKMHVAMYYNNHDIRIEKMPIPAINSNELLVKVKSSGICGSDVMEWYRIKKAPLVLGHEISGDIVEVGKNVEKFKVGDRVFVSHHVPCNNCCFCLNDQHTLCDTLHSTNFYPGGFSEYLRVPEINIDNGTYILPKEISYDEGVFIEPLACVIRGMRIAGMVPNKSVMIIGSGIAGLLHLKLAKLLGASKVISTDINEFRLKFAEKIGSDSVIDARENVTEKLKKFNDGKLADFVFLCTGVTAAVRQAIDSVDRGGTLMFFAPVEPGIDIPFPLFDLWKKEVKMLSTYAGAPRDLEEAIKLISTKKINVKDMISHKLPLTEIKKGFRLVTEAKNSIKVIIVP
jgi:L-iditol 2-dehydrogenase